MSFNLQLILGGARSGKSYFALRQGNECTFASKIFVATGYPGDQEMEERIRRHQKERDASWMTIEEPYELSRCLQEQACHEKCLIILDCATLWVSNLLCGIGGKKLLVPEIEQQFDELISCFNRLKGTLRIVSNEVGNGIIPDNPMARQFRDLHGKLNQDLARVADQVIFMTAGLPQRLK